MKTLIMTDDNSGIKHIDLSKFGLKMMRMPILINGEVYFQDENIDFDKFYEILNDLPNTLKCSRMLLFSNTLF